MSETPCQVFCVYVIGLLTPVLCVFFWMSNWKWQIVDALVQLSWTVPSLSPSLSQTYKNFHSPLLQLTRFYRSHILTILKDKLDSVHIPVSPSFPPSLPTSFFFHSSSNLITLAASSFVKELQSCGAVKTSPPDVQFTWLEKDRGALGVIGRAAQTGTN